jgi:4-oxalocrotonate tautomerase family enzyme
MPIIRVSLLEGWTMEQKAQVTHELTEGLVSVLGEVSRPFIYVVVDEMQAGAVAFAGNVITDEMNQEALALSARQRQTVVNAQRTEEAYAALAAGTTEEVARYWADDVTWSVPGAHPLAGTRHGVDELQAYHKERARLTGGTFSSERRRALIDGRTAVVRSRDTAVRAAPDRRSLAVEALHSCGATGGSPPAARRTPAVTRPRTIPSGAEALRRRPGCRLPPARRGHGTLAFRHCLHHRRLFGEQAGFPAERAAVDGSVPVGRGAGAAAAATGQQEEGPPAPEQP